MTLAGDASAQAAALGGLRVLDMSESIAGQFCCRMMADYGAEVILMEPPQGSSTRGLPPFRAVAGAAPESLTFYHNNLGKRSVVVDRETEAGRRQFVDLIAAVDVVVVPAGTDRALIRAVNAKLIICTIAPFGEGTPKSAWRASEMIIQAMSGMMSNNGRADREPLYGVGERASYCAGVSAYITILSALMARERLGIAQDVAVDIAHTAASMCFPFALQHSYNGSLDGRGKRGQPLIEVKCADCWISIWIRANHFPIICEVLGADALLTDPRFLTDDLRQENLLDLVAEVQKLVRHRSGRELVDALSARRLVAACAYLPSQLGPDAPHLKARDYWQVTSDPDRPHALGPQFRLSRTPRGPLRPSPVLEERDDG